MIDANERAGNAAETVEGTVRIDRDAWKISWDVSQISFLDCFLFPRSRVSRIVVKAGYSFHGRRKTAGRRRCTESADIHPLYTEHRVYTLPDTKPTLILRPASLKVFSPRKSAPRE